jgi:hypothetical protein
VSLGRITDVVCVRCEHVITDHLAEGEHPDHPGMPRTRGRLRVRGLPLVRPADLSRMCRVTLALVNCRHHTRLAGISSWATAAPGGLPPTGLRLTARQIEVPSAGRLLTDRRRRGPLYTIGSGSIFPKFFCVEPRDFSTYLMVRPKKWRGLGCHVA